jgi:hypothetical protein
VLLLKETAFGLNKPGLALLWQRMRILWELVLKESSNEFFFAVVGHAGWHAAMQVHVPGGRQLLSQNAATGKVKNISASLGKWGLGLCFLLGRD